MRMLQCSGRETVVACIRMEAKDVERSRVMFIGDRTGKIF